MCEDESDDECVYVCAWLWMSRVQDSEKSIVYVFVCSVDCLYPHEFESCGREIMRMDMWLCVFGWVV